VRRFAKRASLVAVIVLTGTPGLSGAQVAEPLPAKLDGRWTVVPPGGRTIINSWAIRFEPPGTTGTVRGRLDWRGLNCGALDLPVEAQWDGTELRFEAVLRANTNTQNLNGTCQDVPTRYVLRRKPGERSFEGEAKAANFVVQVTASP
jgi:hypothetical protein